MVQFKIFKNALTNLHFAIENYREYCNLVWDHKNDLA
jgi:hypothetical protein